MTSIFDILNINGSLCDEIYKIDKLFLEEEVMITKNHHYECYSSLKTYISSNLFREWEHRGTCLSIDEAIKRITSNVDKKNLSENQYFLYIEFIVNMLELFVHHKCEENNNQIRTIIGNIAKILKDCNKYIEKVDSKYYVLEKDSTVTAVADMINDTQTAITVVAYNYISNKENISEKQKILKILADDFEARIEKLKVDGRYSGLVKDLGFLFNNLNIRHNNMKKSQADINFKNITSNELEKYYDMTYRRYLMAVLACDELDTRKQIEGIKKKSTEY